MSTDRKTDFSQGAVWRNVVAQAVPLTLAQFVQLLYNVVDRIYIGHLPGANSLALTGIGLAFPLTTLVLAFTQLSANGGTPLFSIARGRKEEEKAEKIMGNVFTMLLVFSVILFAFCYMFRKPVLYLFGASDASYIYADAYLKIYLFGTIFSMISVGMNGFISAQGFPRIGMMTTVIGAVINLVLDPLFIFTLDMGVSGAALATVISQLISAIWVLRFLTGKQAILRIRWKCMKIDWKLMKEITVLGFSGFIMRATNTLVQISCNKMLNIYGGDLYIGVMTVLNSVQEVFGLPVQGIATGSQPVLGYNYGAKEYHRVKQAIRFMTTIGMGFTMLMWALVLLFPRELFSIFTSDQTLIDAGVGALKIYFMGYCFQTFQFCGQSTFVGLGKSKQAIIFSLLRKVVIVVPLTLMLPGIGLGVNGVFLAEPISNVVGGLACFITMYVTVYRKLE